MDLRRMIEPAAAALAAQRRTAKDLARITAAYTAMERAKDAVLTFMDADLAFHIACLEATHNEFLSPIAHAIRTELMTSMRVTNRDPDENQKVSLPLHRAIRDAIAARDPVAARVAMQKHLDDTEGGGGGWGSSGLQPLKCVVVVVAHDAILHAPYTVCAT